MYSTFIAYLLWLVSGFGALGFQRFYLNKFGTGILFLLTGGLVGLGGLYDLFTLPAQVREANLRLRYHDALRREMHSLSASPAPAKRESIEKVILRTAKKHGGRATPAAVALEGDVSIEEAKRDLEKLVTKGYAEMKVTKDGTIVYLFPDLAPGVSEADFEDF